MRTKAKRQVAQPALEPHAGFPGLDLPPPTALFKALEELPPPLASRWTSFANAVLTEGAMPPTLRELVILRTAARLRAGYVLGPHTLIGRHLGLSARDVEIATDPGATGGEFAHNYLAGGILDATDQVLRTGKIEVAPRDAIVTELGRGTVTELAMVVGQYVTVAYICGVNRLEAETARRQPP